MLNHWKQWARTVKRDAHALYLAARDPRVPWYAKALAVAQCAGECGVDNDRVLTVLMTKCRDHLRRIVAGSVKQ
jgi:hypothetical protein